MDNHDMDDLFGGLPAVSKTENLNPVNEKTSAATSTTVKKTVAMPTSAVSGEKKTLPEKRTMGGTSLVRSLGTAGTAMAFVPNAIRNKKKKEGKSTSQLNSMIKRSNTAATATVPHQQKQIPASTLGVIHTDNGAYGDYEANKDQVTDDLHPDDDNNNEPYLENEPESLRLLHASVTDPYDPHRPNDYLAYRERKKTEQARKDLQRSALRRLDAQEKMRKKIEEERRELLASGDLDKIVDSRVDEEFSAASNGDGAAVLSGRGRGRGRGVANLPAWLVKKQQEQKKAKAQQSETAPADGQFDDSTET